jgi:hypothetical protein
MTAVATCCICIGLTQQCLADEALFTCTDKTGYNYIAEGGQEKPGWKTYTATSDVIKLIQVKPGFFDIQTISQLGAHSSKDACSIEKIFNFDVLHLDQAFVMTCKEEMWTLLFYTRSGVLLSYLKRIFGSNTPIRSLG